MSQHPQPYVAPPPPPRRPRPRAVWFFVAGGLLVLAPVVFVASLFTVLSPLFHEDAVFRADGVHRVDLPAGEERGLFQDGLLVADCQITDEEDGSVVEQRPISGEVTINSWTGVTRFDTGSGRLSFDCRGESPRAEVRVGPLPSTGGIVTGILVGIVVPLVLGGVGVIWLIVLAVLYGTGAPRNK